MSVRCPDAALAVRPPGPALPGRSSPAPGRHFLVSGFQTEVTFPQGVASAVAQMSPITGKVTATVRLVGAIPDSRAVAESFVATIPASVPAPASTSGCRPAPSASASSPRHLRPSPWRRRVGSL